MSTVAEDIRAIAERLEKLQENEYADNMAAEAMMHDAKGALEFHGFTQAHSGNHDVYIHPHGHTAIHQKDSEYPNRANRVHLIHGSGIHSDCQATPKAVSDMLSNNDVENA